MSFPIGRTVATPGAISAMVKGGFSLLSLLDRHLLHDWGDVDEHDQQVNDRAVEDGTRIFSVYKKNGRTIWVITEGDRSVTTLLLPEEY